MKEQGQWVMMRKLLDTERKHLSKLPMPPLQHKIKRAEENGEEEGFSDE